MKKTRYTEEQIIGAIKQHEAGAKVEDICRKLSISNGTFYNWRSEYAGLEVNEAKRLRELEAETNKLKEAGGEQAPGSRGHEGRALKKVVKPSDRKAAARHLIEHFRISERASSLPACWHSRPAYQYHARSRQDGVLRAHFKQLAASGLLTVI